MGRLRVFFYLVSLATIAVAVPSHAQEKCPGLREKLAAMRATLLGGAPKTPLKPDADFYDRIKATIEDFYERHADQALEGNRDALFKELEAARTTGDPRKLTAVAKRILTDPVLRDDDALWEVVGEIDQKLWQDLSMLRKRSDLARALTKNTPHLRKPLELASLLRAEGIEERHISKLLNDLSATSFRDPSVIYRLPDGTLERSPVAYFGCFKRGCKVLAVYQRSGDIRNALLDAIRESWTALRQACARRGKSSPKVCQRPMNESDLAPSIAAVANRAQLQADPSLTTAETIEKQNGLLEALSEGVRESLKANPESLSADRTVVVVDGRMTEVDSWTFPLPLSHDQKNWPLISIPMDRFDPTAIFMELYDPPSVPLSERHHWGDADRLAGYAELTTAALEYHAKNGKTASDKILARQYLRLQNGLTEAGYTIATEPGDTWGTVTIRNLETRERWSFDPIMGPVPFKERSATPWHRLPEPVRTVLLETMPDEWFELSLLDNIRVELKRGHEKFRFGGTPYISVVQDWKALPPNIQAKVANRLSELEKVAWGKILLSQMFF